MLFTKKINTIDTMCPKKKTCLLMTDKGPKFRGGCN